MNNLWLITRGSPHVYGQKELEILMSKTKVARISYLNLKQSFPFVIELVFSSHTKTCMFHAHYHIKGRSHDIDLC